jgi:hypothetical protein|tara:strand:+ start:3213 stop:3386 length:174 start_codon:yes stop_codon:yes gene_type:complete
MIEEKKNKIQEYMNEEYIEYTLWAAGALLLIYVSGIAMKVVGNTANSYKFMSNALKQ